MKKSILIFAALFALCFTASAQKFALIDLEYIMGKIPAYASANEQLKQSSQKYQTEVEAVTKQAQTLFKDYQAKQSMLPAAQKTKKEDEIVAKEKEAAELKRMYFGPEGELAKLQDRLIQPIQDKVYEAVKQIAELQGYAVVLDRASASAIIFASPRIDISNQVLARLGYSN